MIRLPLDHDHTARPEAGCEPVPDTQRTPCTRPTLVEGTRVPPTATRIACEQCIHVDPQPECSARCPLVGHGVSHAVAHASLGSLSSDKPPRGQRTLSAECKHSLGGVGVSQPLTTPHLWPPTDLCGMVFSRVESFLISGITLAMVALTVDTQHRVA